MNKLVKQDAGVSIYETDGSYVMYIEELKILEIDKEFKGMLDKSYNNLVELRKKKSKS